MGKRKGPPKETGSDACGVWGLLILSVVLLAPAAVFSDPVPVATRKLGDLLIFPLRDAPATAISLNDSHISSELTGQIEDIRVQVGDAVGKGDVIAALDCKDYEIGLRQAEAAYKAAEATHKFNRSQLQNARRLSKKRNIAKEELDQRISEAQVSGAEVDRLRASTLAARRKVEKCLIRAPFNAVVVERLSSVGDYAVPGTVLVRLLDQDQIEISAKVQEQDLDELKTAGALNFVTKTGSYPLRIRTILPLMESRIRSYEVRLTFQAEKAAPGTAGRLQWKLQTGRIPSGLLIRRGLELGIFVEEDGRAHFRQIKGAAEGRPVVALLPPSSRVIVSGQWGLRDGEQVKVAAP